MSTKWWVGLGWNRIPYEERVGLVHDLLLNRALMLDKQGRAMPGWSLFGVVPPDEEVWNRARDIVEATGRARPLTRGQVLERELERFEEEIAERFSKRLHEAFPEVSNESPE